MTNTSLNDHLASAEALAAIEVAADEYRASSDYDDGAAASWERCQQRIRELWAELPSGWQDDPALWQGYSTGRRYALAESLAVLP